VASDFCRQMLDRGEANAAKAGRGIEWVEADAMRLPFAAAEFDLVTVAFGLRNIADTARGLAEMARVTKPGGKLAILDVCCGTGDLALAYAAKAGPDVRIVASDFCRPMLDRGEVKAAKAGRAIEWIEADAMRLPFAAAEFDLVTVAFGLRNIADTSRGLAEMARVTKPGGKLAILEFSLPQSAAIRTGYLWYFRNVLPRLGNAVARNGSDAYTYLNQSVEEFPSGERLAALVRTAGFDAVEMVPLSFGIATLTIATRSATAAGAAHG
jgi:demethylmenaquinone methyltransferase/2-methoxy-6-polyprenyl-1,4-benzoquinol methylase